jgi:hypothetical protein
MTLRTLVLLLTSSALGAQTPLRIETDWSLYGSRIRMRSLDDTANKWFIGRARIVDAHTYEVVDYGGRLVMTPSTPFRIEAEVPTQSKWSHIKWGAGIGALVGAAGTVLYATTCTNTHAEGPPCGIAIVLTPYVAGLGTVVGGLVGSALPMNPWREVKYAR